MYFNWNEDTIRWYINAEKHTGFYGKTCILNYDNPSAFYLAAAKRLGISAGVGNNMFAPDKEVSRQEMFALLYNTLKVAGVIRFQLFSYFVKLCLISRVPAVRICDG